MTEDRDLLAARERIAELERALHQTAGVLETAVEEMRPAALTANVALITDYANDFVMAARPAIRQAKKALVASVESPTPRPTPQGSLVIDPSCLINPSKPATKANIRPVESPTPQEATGGSSCPCDPTASDGLTCPDPSTGLPLCAPKIEQPREDDPAVYISRTACSRCGSHNANRDTDECVDCPAGQPPVCEPQPPLWWTPAMQAAARAYGQTLYRSDGYGYRVKEIIEAYESAAAALPVEGKAAIKRSVLHDYRIQGEVTIAYEVNHRFGVLIEWQPDTGRGPAIRLNACTATLGHIPTAYRLRDAFSLAIAEAHAIVRAMDAGETFDPDAYVPVERPVEGEARGILRKVLDFDTRGLREAIGVINAAVAVWKLGIPDGEHVPVWAATNAIINQIAVVEGKSIKDVVAELELDDLLAVPVESEHEVTPNTAVTLREAVVFLEDFVIEWMDAVDRLVAEGPIANVQARIDCYKKVLSGVPLEVLMGASEHEVTDAGAVLAAARGTSTNPADTAAPPIIDRSEHCKEIERRTKAFEALATDQGRDDD